MQSDDEMGKSKGSGAVLGGCVVAAQTSQRRLQHLGHGEAALSGGFHKLGLEVVGNAPREVERQVRALVVPKVVVDEAAELLYEQAVHLGLMAVCCQEGREGAQIAVGGGFAVHVLYHLGLRGAISGVEGL